MSGASRLAAVVAGALLSAAASAGPVIKVGVDPNSDGAYGHLQQKDVPLSCGVPDGGEKFGCGPTAAVNSFVYLQNTYPDRYGKKLVPELVRTNAANDLNRDGKVDGYDDMINATEDLAEYMSTCCNRATFRTDFYSGKRRYIEDHAPNVTDYAAMDDPVNDRRDGGLRFPDDTPDLVRSTPSASFLVDGLREGQDIEILVFFVNNRGELIGHYLTVTGLEWADDDMNGKFDPGEAAKIHLIDPQQAAGITRDLSIGDDGHLSFIGATSLQIDIRFAVDESPRFRKTDPIPAPGAIWLLGFLAPLLAWSRSRARHRPLTGSRA